MADTDRSVKMHVSNSGHGLAKKDTRSRDIVLDNSIFSNVFDKDIRRVFIYKKSERLGSALYLIAPAFRDSMSLRVRAESVALALTAAAAAPPRELRATLSRELLALSSVLSMARSGGLLSPMNADLIHAEARSLLEDVAAYEEPHVLLAQAPTLAGVARDASETRIKASPPRGPSVPIIKDKVNTIKGQITGRQESILSFIGHKGRVSIRDIATVIPGISDKTVQRELQSLIASGQVIRQGERRWSTYSLASGAA